MKGQLLVASDLTGWGRCPRCGRVLYITRGKVPNHRTPPLKPPIRRGVRGSTPLTGRDQPWCSGMSK